MVTELAKGVYWVGVVDWAIRHFHGHELSTHRGTTYNAYLIRDEKTVLVDTVWGPFEDALIENICQVVDPSKIDLVVANHAEPDHSGGLPAVMRHCPQATVVVSKRGAESIPGHYHQTWNFQAVTTGDKIHIGASDLVFVEAPMLHWPDSMFTYLSGAGILMPNDAFGQHYATAYRFNDQVDQGELSQEALKYYANILTPFSPLVTKKIDEVLGLGLRVAMIAPSHGVIWRADPLQIVKHYQQWAAQVPENRAAVLYDTMWHATRRMAEAIGAGLAAEGVPCKLLHMAVTDRNDAIVEMFRSKAILIGSPTLNNGLFPTVASFLAYMKGLKPLNKIGAAFGSYGWGGGAKRATEAELKAAGIDLVESDLDFNYRPDEAELAKAVRFGGEIAEKIKSE